MCGRYLYDKNEQTLFKYYQEIRNRDENITITDSETIYPSQYVVTLGANPENEIVPGVTRWGFTGFKPNQLLINARVESVRDKKTFRESFEQRRLVFPMSGFHEFSESKKAFTFSNAEKILYVAGFYRIHPDEKTGKRQAESIIMTTDPDKTVAPIHDRMPLIIQEADIASWILDDDFAFSYKAAETQNLLMTPA